MHNTYIMVKLSVQSACCGHDHHNNHYSASVKVSNHTNCVFVAMFAKHTVGAISYIAIILSHYMRDTITAAINITIITENTIRYVIVSTNSFQANRINTPNPKNAEAIKDKNTMSID